MTNTLARLEKNLQVLIEALGAKDAACSIEQMEFNSKQELAECVENELYYMAQDN